MDVAKIKALISCVLTAQLIFDFDFAYAKSRLSHYAAHLVYNKKHKHTISYLFRMFV